MRNWPLFTYHPGTNRWIWFYAPAVRNEGPAMHWYGWTANTLIGSAVLGMLAAHAAGKDRQQDSVVAGLDLAARRGAGPDLCAEILLAVVSL